MENTFVNTSSFRSKQKQQELTPDEMQACIVVQACEDRVPVVFAKILRKFRLQFLPEVNLGVIPSLPPVHLGGVLINAVN